MRGNKILKTYALFYISENDDLDYSRKLNLFNIIENSNDDELIELFLIGDIELFEEAVHMDKEESIKALLKMIGRNKAALEKLKAPGGGFYSNDLRQKNILQMRISDAQEKIAELKKATGDVAKDTAKDVATNVGDKVEAAKDAVKAAGQTVKDKAVEAGEKVAGAAGKAAEFAQGHGGTTALVAAAAAAALTAGVVAYKRFFSKGARACKNHPDRAACMKDLKKKAMGARIQAMNAGKAKCATVKNADKCKAKIDQKIAAIKTKMAG